MNMAKKSKLENCHDCGAKPGELHVPGCDVEQCSACGGQWIGCGCEGHDPRFAKWTGIWPGLAEAEYLGLTLNDIYDTFIENKSIAEILFIKPKEHGNDQNN